MHYRVMKTVPDIISAFGGSSELARRLEVPIPTVGAWRFRGSIPPKHFADIVTLAKADGIKGITFECLHSMRREKA